MEQLLTAGGGKIVKRAVPTKQKQERLLVLLSDKDAARAATVLEECKELPLTANWVFDSVSLAVWLARPGAAPMNIGATMPVILHGAARCIF